MSIDNYFSYFNTQLSEVGGVNDQLFKKILLVTMLDTLARAPFPTEKSNKKRFVGFIDKFADWDEKDRISLPQLSLLLETTDCSKLKNEVNQRLANWESGKEIYLTDDPECAEILSLSSTDEVDLLKQARHTNLFYVYRNHLVHEFRKPGYGIEHADDDSPFYLETEDLESGITTWELVYPVKFFKGLVCSSLNGLKSYLEEKNIDPHASYSFGSTWNNRL